MNGPHTQLLAWLFAALCLLIFYFFVIIQQRRDKNTRLDSIIQATYPSNEDDEVPEHLHGWCFYTRHDLKGNGDVWVCLVHDQVSKHHVTGHDSDLPCLEVDPY